ncbi:MAG: HEPN domain-containing protein [Nitrososphaerales archaeon]
MDAEATQQLRLKYRDSKSQLGLAFDREEYERWIKQAKDTLESAEEDMGNRRFNWSCFKAQQAAEYAVKGLLYGLGSIPAGHSILGLLGRLKRRGVDVGDCLKHARLLDRHYIPTRYPNAHPEGAPYEYYDEEAAKEALRSAREILKLVEEEARKCLK